MACYCPHCTFCQGLLRSRKEQGNHVAFARFTAFCDQWAEHNILQVADTACFAFTHITQRVPMQDTTRPCKTGGGFGPSCRVTFLQRLGKIGMGSQENPNPKRANAIVALPAKGVTRDYPFDMARAELFGAVRISRPSGTRLPRPATRFRLDKAAL